MPLWIAKSQRNDSTKGLNTDNLYQLISGRISASSLKETSSTGETNLSNWELVRDAVITRTGKQATAKFNLTSFDYVYCLAAHFLPFEVIKDVSIKQQGVTIITDSQFENATFAGSDVAKYYYVHLDMLPAMKYFYKEYKKTTKTNPDSLYKYLGFYSYVEGYQPEIRVEIFENINHFFPKSFATEIKYDVTEQFNVILNGLLLNFNSATGDLESREIKNGDPNFETIYIRLENYFGRVGSGLDYGKQTISTYPIVDTAYVFYSSVGGYEVNLDHNFNFTSANASNP